MGQKVNPVGFRTGIMEGWKSRWYASKQEFKELLIEDFRIRKFIHDKYKFAGIPKVEPKVAGIPSVRPARAPRGAARESGASHPIRPSFAGESRAATDKSKSINPANVSRSPTHHSLTHLLTKSPWEDR